MQNIRCNPPGYDRKRGVHHAEVDLERNGKVYRYPCEVHAPPDMDPGWVMNALTRQALAKADRRRDGRLLH